jgi:hypothetical protein
MLAVKCGRCYACRDFFILHHQSIQPMPWLNAVQDRILQEIYQHADAKKQLMEALRWRGFLAFEKDGLIVLNRSSEQSGYPGDQRDISILRDHKTLQVADFPTPEFTEADRRQAAENLRRELADLPCPPVPLTSCATVEWARGISDEDRRLTMAAILRLGSPQGGMTTAGGSHPDYGYFLPSAELDQGIALLARSMALLGLRTFLSGHSRTEQCRLFVSFDDQPSANKFHDLFGSELRPRLRRDAGDMFTFQVDHAYEEFLVGRSTNDPDEAWRFFDAAKQLGSEILDNLPELRSRL